MSVAEDICPSCSAGLVPGARFCSSCGTPVAPPSCTSCGEPLPNQARFCSSCGTPVGARPDPTPSTGGPVAERRVTSILFADLVGFTPLSESRDAEDVRELLSRYFDICRVVLLRYGGTVEKFIGDAVMAVWGVPVAHEDDADRAVRAGLELVQEVTALGQEVGIPGLAMRVGIVTGEVAVTIGAEAEGMVAGDSVNTAARVQSTAEPGEVWVDERTRALTSGGVAYVDRGEHELKGKREPMRLFEATAVVGGVGAGQRADGLEAPLTGRASELRLLKELFHANEESGRPRLVILDGEPGIGKSRLAWEFEKYVDGLADSVRWHRGRCLAYGDGVAFWALAEAVRSRLGLVETDTGPVVAQQLDAGLARYVTDPEERAWLRPRLATLIGSASEIAFAREDLFTAWTTFLERVGGGDAVVLVIDDAQSADDGLLDFIDHLLATARARIFVLALARPELLARRPSLGGRRAHVIRLDSLDDAEMAELVDGLVDGLPSDAREALVARADGVPLFAVETVRALIDRDVVEPRGGRYVFASSDLDLDVIGAPASLHALVSARLDALSIDERRVVTSASVLGSSFTRDALEAVAASEGGRAAGDMEVVLVALQRKEILALQTDRFSSERGQFRFVQAVVRQVAYSTQSKRDRKSRHIAAAAYLSAQPDENDDLAVVIAQHLLDAVDASSTTDTDVPELTTRAIDLLTRAAGRATRLGAPSEAHRLALSALERSSDLESRARLHLLAAAAASNAGDHDEAIAQATAAVRGFDDLGLPIPAGEAASVHAISLGALGENLMAIEIAREWWQRLDRLPGAERSLIRLATALVDAHFARAEHDQVAIYADRQLILSTAVDDADGLATALNSLGVRYASMGVIEPALILYQGAAEVTRRHDIPQQLARSLMNIGAILVSRDLDTALRCGEESLEAARRAGNSIQMSYTALNHLLGLWTVGDFHRAKELVVEAREYTTETTAQTILTTIEGWLADAQGEPLPPPSKVASTDGESEMAWRANLEILRLMTSGDPQAGAELARTSMPHLLAANGIDDDFPHLWPTLVQAALSAGDADLAHQLIEPVDVAAPGRVSPLVAALHRRLCGLVAAAQGAQPDVVEEHLRAGLDQLTTFGAVGLAAQAAAELGEWLLTQDRAGDALVLLDRARTTYVQLGARGWLARIETADLPTLSG